MGAPDVLIASIELDTSIQCRAAIDTGIVNEYAERMQAGDVFPPIDLYGTAAQNWIGDGWHRVLAARQVGAQTISAVLHPGGRAEALRHALHANADHGHRRTKADKRRAVEIALREFPTVTQGEIAEMCECSRQWVNTVAGQVVNSLQPEREAASHRETVTGRDGKQYQATKPKAEPPQPKEEPRQEEERRPQPKLGPPCVGMQFARIAVMNLEEIRRDDLEREQAFQAVERWLREHA